MEFQPMAEAGQIMPSGTLTERYARLVEAQIHAAPSDWPWSHKRWKLKKSVYLSRA
jgi:Kdo2-lipid IVA lauroyltransferase/acyltransferase